MPKATQSVLIGANVPRCALSIYLEHPLEIPLFASVEVLMQKRRRKNQHLKNNTVSIDITAVMRFLQRKPQIMLPVKMLSNCQCL